MAEFPLNNLKDQFRQMAAQAGWPQEVIEEIEVQATEDGELSISYDPSMQEQIYDLEYGKFEIKPKPAIRNFTRKSDAELGDAVLEKVLEDEAYSTGIL